MQQGPASSTAVEGRNVALDGAGFIIYIIYIIYIIFIKIYNI